MKRFVTLTLVLTVTTALAAVYLKEKRNPDPISTVPPSQATVNPADGATLHGLIARVDNRNRSLDIQVNGHQKRIFWDDHTLITVARHRVKPSALEPGATIFVDVQPGESQLRATLIAVSPPDLAW